ncbi:hypothetical protein LTR74_016527 [Friedmanniomyces endolithicus]|nr:hypothetical protein LTR74_016527 [Friedmanniomyces endolithicus]
MVGLDRAAWGSQGSTAASLPSGYEDEIVSTHGRTAEEGLDESDDDDEDDEHNIGNGRPQHYAPASASTRYDSADLIRRQAGVMSPPPRTSSTRAVRSPSLASESTVRQDHHQHQHIRNGSGNGSLWSAKHRALLSPARLRAEKRVSLLSASASDETATAPLVSPTLSNGTGSVGRHPRPEGWWSSGADEDSGEEGAEVVGGLGRERRPSSAEAKAGRKVGRGGLEMMAEAGVGGASGSGGGRKRRREGYAEPEREGMGDVVV